MCPTLKSCISELNEYFFKISKDLKRSVSKLYNAPNTLKNGHLTQKLCSMKDIKFSKKCEKELKHPHLYEDQRFHKDFVGFLAHFREFAGVDRQMKLQYLGAQEELVGQTVIGT